MKKTADLLHVTEDVLAAVEDAFSLLWVQVEDEVGGVVGIGVFIPTQIECGCQGKAFDFGFVLSWANTLFSAQIFTLETPYYTKIQIYVTHFRLFIYYSS